MGDGEIRATFVLEKTTKGAVRFKEEGDNPKIVTLYIRKWALPEKLPQRIEVTVKVVQ